MGIFAQKVISSHYVYKNFEFDHDGNRYAVGTRDPESDLIGNYYYNPKSKTKTIYALVFDLDASRADAKWKDEEGRLDWGLIGNRIAEDHPPIFKHIFSAPRSTGGKGLAPVIAISPFEVKDETKPIQNAARALQKAIFNIFNSYGMGADPGALGIVRDCPNWRNAEKVIDEDTNVISLIQKDRSNVVSELLAYTNSLDLLKYVKKKDRSGFLYPQITVERKLAKLYWHLFDAGFQACMTCEEIQKLTKISCSILRKVLKAGLPWLKAEYLGRHEGWKLILEPEQVLSHRAEQLLYDLPKVGIGNVHDLKHPQDVEDGERNDFITKLALLAKWSGLDLSEALRIVRCNVNLIPGNETSRNCRMYETKVENIYFRKPETAGSLPDCLPEWVHDACRPKSLSSNRSSQKVKVFKKAKPGGGGNRSAGSDELPLVMVGMQEGIFEIKRTQGDGELPRGKQQLESYDTEAFHDMDDLEPLNANSKRIKKPETFPIRRLLSTNRRRDFARRHPLDRFQNSLLRTKLTPRQIFEHLLNLDLRLRYVEVSKGPFRRIVQAFLVMPLEMQREALAIVGDVMRDFEVGSHRSSE